MSDVFDEDDAELVLRLYLKSPDVIEEFIQFRADEDTRLHIARLARMNVVYILPLEEEDNDAEYYAGSIEPEFYVWLNPGHPEVKAIIDAMELL